MIIMNKDGEPIGTTHTKADPLNEDGFHPGDRVKHLEEMMSGKVEPVPGTVKSVSDMINAYDYAGRIIVVVWDDGIEESVCDNLLHRL